MTVRPRVGVQPGSFNPPTIAHLALGEAARAQHRLDRVVWSVSRVALAKEAVQHPRFDDRIDVLHAVESATPWLEIVVTDAQLLVDVSRGFDLLILGADKWAQIQQPEWYGGVAERDAAIAQLPPVAVAPRPPHPLPPQLALHVDPAHESVSSTNARQGAIEQMLPEARAFAERTGAWIDPDRYLRWLDPAPRSGEPPTQF